MTPDHLGHVGYLLLIAGTRFVTTRPRLGWPLRAAGTATWLGIGVWIGMPSIWLWSVPFLAVDLYECWRAYARG